jgi:hypothetical protein
MTFAQRFPYYTTPAAAALLHAVAADFRARREARKAIEKARAAAWGQQ